MKLRNYRNGIRTLWAAALLSGGLFGQTTGTYTYNGLPLPIYTDASNLITVAYIVVPNALTMSKVTAQVQIQYPNTGDLKVYLYSPSGTRTILLEHNCSVQNVDTTFDDAATSNWKDFCPVEAGRGPFRADEPLSNFNKDGSSFGTWRLAVENDESDSRSGWITGFSLTITGTQQLNPITNSSEIVNLASLGGAGTIAPGEVVSIFGFGLGPLPGVSAPTGAIPTSLSGTSVLVNGVAIPIFYASSYRVDAQMPFGLTPGGTATVQVNSTGGSGVVLTLNTVDAVPGVYTTGLGGVGSRECGESGWLAEFHRAPSREGELPHNLCQWSGSCESHTRGRRSPAHEPALKRIGCRYRLYWRPAGGGSVLPVRRQVIQGSIR